jgi:EAL domain-containing protein (putative c-di-GMP-specific phosphodiesterase class I)/GGDEF domain-containing protein
MPDGLPYPWEEMVFRLEHAFQPIASFADGSAYGFEALLRGWEDFGFSGIGEIFDTAFEEKVLYEFDLALRAKAFRKFAAAGLGRAKIFYNIDTRLLQMPDYRTGNTIRIAEEAGLSPSRIVMELTELFEPDQRTGFDRVVSSYRNQGFRIALDDFGSGYAGLKLLHRAAPDIIKIDRYFVAGSAEDPRKAAFLAKITGMARLMGIKIVAEGVETEDERLVCASAGCDYVQGYLVARPTTDAGALLQRYEAASGGQPSHGRASRGDERRHGTCQGHVDASRLTRREPIAHEVPLSAVLARFRKEPNISFLPVVNQCGEPIGIYRERDFREYVYSPFGIALLEHLEAEDGAARFLARAPVVPLGTELGRIVEAYGVIPASGGIVVTEGGRYAGVIEADELLSIVAERELVEARDQNPLSRLPGNHRIAENCAERLADPGPGTAFAYFDFDNFKPFNDLYGFRNGDRVIMLFADILRSTFGSPADFIGHLGGDDFFVSLESPEPGPAVSKMNAVAQRFALEATSFYAAEDRERGWIMGRDRDGIERCIGLLGVSVAVVYLRRGACLDAEGLSELLAALKREAKASDKGLALRVVEPTHSDLRNASQSEASGADNGNGGGGQRRPAGHGRDGALPTRSERAFLPAEPVFTPSLLAAH